MIWIDRPLALAIHERQLAEHGGRIGVRDESLLESALTRPRQLQAYGEPKPDLAALAAGLAFGLTRSLPFVDGNKRTAHVCHLTFLALNHATLGATLPEMYVHVLALAEGSLSEAEFACWLRPRLRFTGGAVNGTRAGYRS